MAESKIGVDMKTARLVLVISGVTVLLGGIIMFVEIPGSSMYF